MKFTYAVAALVAAAASVQASETNAHRMARGLNPLPPRNLHHASRTNSESKILSFHKPILLCPHKRPGLPYHFPAAHTRTSPLTFFP